MKIDTNVVAQMLADKISENIKIDTVYDGGKIKANLSINQDYLRGITDTINILASMDIEVFE